MFVIVRPIDGKSSLGIEPMGRGRKTKRDHSGTAERKSSALRLFRSGGPSPERGSPTGDDLDQNRGYGENEEEMYEPSQSVGADHAQKPHDQKNDEDRPEHTSLLCDTHTRVSDKDGF